MGKLDRIARAFGCHAHSMQLSAKEGQPQDFQTDPLPGVSTPRPEGLQLSGYRHVKCPTKTLDMRAGRGSIGQWR
jgi:hypothetical protein